MSLRRLLSFTCFSLLAVAGADRAGAAEPVTPRTYTIKGTVVAPLENHKIVIAHEEVPDFMAAMTMPFYVRDPHEAEALRRGDEVEFMLHVGTSTQADSFRKTGFHPLPAAATPPSAPRPVASARLKPGGAVAPFALTDETGAVVSDEALQGHLTVVSFLFTRCPIPEFCPLTARKLGELQRELRSRTGTTAPVQLLTVTIDPEHDSAEVLKEYAKSVGADHTVWRFLTGKPEEVEKLTRQFAIHVERNGGSIDHTLATALVGPDGRLIEVWRGSQWPVAEVLARIDAGK